MWQQADYSFSPQNVLSLEATAVTHPATPREALHLPCRTASAVFPTALRDHLHSHLRNTVQKIGTGPTSRRFERWQVTSINVEAPLEKIMPYYG